MKKKNPELPTALLNAPNNWYALLLDLEVRVEQLELAQQAPAEENSQSTVVTSITGDGEDDEDASGDLTIEAGLGLRRIITDDSLILMRQGVDHEHGLARWWSDGGTIFELPDVWDAVTAVTIRGVLEDPLMYSLSRDGTQLIFNDPVPVDWAIVALGAIRQI